MPKWSVIYEKAVRDDGTLFFPERLTHEFLESAKRSMGSYLFANQYQNEIIPLEDQVFRPEWMSYYKELPTIKHTFAFIDPAISQEEHADFTALVVVDVDIDQNWYVRNATRFKINPTKIVDLIFRVQDQFQCQGIGIEDVAFQKALIHMVGEEMKRRGVVLPISGIRPDTNKTKQMRILGLVPRFEWGRIKLAQGLHDLELEMAQFPRGAHDDLLDALAYIDRIAFYPVKEKEKYEPPAINSPEYEKWYIRNIEKVRSRGVPRPGESSSETYDY